MEVVTSQTSYAHGEISPWAYGRSDIAQYKSSVRKMTNYIPRPQGPAARRPGTKFIIPIKNQESNNTRLIGFEYATGDSLVLELGDQYIRFHTSEGTVLSGKTIVNGDFDTDLSGWTAGNSGTGSAVQNAGLADISGGSSGVGAIYQTLSHIGVSSYTITLDVFDNDISYNIGTSATGTEITSGTLTTGLGKTITFTPTANYETVYFRLSNANNNVSRIDNVSINSPIYEIKSPYTENMLGFINTDQAYDTMYIACRGVRPKELVRVDASSFTLKNHNFYDGPYYNKSDLKWGGVGTKYTLAITGSTSAGSSVTITSSSPLFASTDVGRWVRYRTLLTDAWGSLLITGFTSSTSVTATVEKVLSGTSASTEWRLGYFSDTTGWPELVSLFSSRMVWHKTESDPLQYFFSSASDISNHDPDNASDKDEIDPDTAYVVRGQATKGSYSYSMLAVDRNLFTFSSGGVTLIRSSTANETISFQNTKVDKVLNTSCAAVIPEAVDSLSVFVDNTRRSLNELSYSFQEDRFVIEDLSLLSDHCTEGLIGQVVYSRVPNRLLWIRNLDGSLFTTTYDKGQNITGWAEQRIGGTNSKVENICVIPSSDQDQLWMIVSRTIEGTTKKYIEYLSPFHTEVTADNCAFSDSFITYNGSPNNVLTGADHLDGENLVCFGDGAVVSVVGNVVDGEITLQDSVSKAVLGLPYESYLETNPIVVESLPGATIGRKARVSEIHIRFNQSYGGRVGLLDGSNSISNEIPEMSTNVIMDSPLEFFTGIKYFPTGNTFSREARISISTSTPTPHSIVSMVYYTSMSNR